MMQPFDATTIEPKVPASAVAAIVAVGIFLYRAFFIGLNAMFWFATPGEWADFCERRPSIAGLVKVIRAERNFDLRMAFDGLRQFAMAHTPPGIPHWSKASTHPTVLASGRIKTPPPASAVPTIDVELQPVTVEPDPVTSPETPVSKRIDENNKERPL